ncbi:MAG: hypothetical protein KIT31_34610 [Deltaproteobacteria bacterium]|nr:hypothetical protein [Deltaproteobacteria bacterium]
MRYLATAVVLAACGNTTIPCSIPCADGCPDDTVCSAGFCAPPAETCEPAFAAVRAGTGFACALDQHRRLWCWGDNANREILGSTAPRHLRAVLAGDRRWDALAIGGRHGCALDGGELWCWGDNDRGQVSGDAPPDTTEPFAIRAGVAWTAVSAGPDSTCAIGDGRLFCWGSGRGGKLGTGLVDDEPFPEPVMTSLADWALVATGARHTCAVSRSAGLHCWGDGSSGQLGNGLSVLRPFPEHVELPGEVTSLALGLDTTCATTATGDLYCWGRAADGALGDPHTIDPDGPDRTTPARATSLTGWSEVASAERYTCARRGTEVWCWGSALAGGIGDGRWRSERTFARVLDGASSLAVGWNEPDLDLTCATVGAEVRCWGDNRSGQLAQDTATRSTSPTPIADGHRWSSLVAGASHTCGIAAGTAYCWGSAERGQVDGTPAVPCTPERCDAGAPVPVATAVHQLVAGTAHTCARFADRIACWGANDAGQSAAPAELPAASALLGAGPRATCAATTNATTCWGDLLVPSAALDGATSVALGADYGCALDAAHQLACFGAAARFGHNTAAGTCGDGTCNAGETSTTCAADCGPPPLTHLGRAYTAIAAGGEDFTCGLRTDGAVECWGDNFYGQTGQPTGDASPTPFALPLASCTRLAAGHSHACALCAGRLACWGDASHGELGEPLTLASVTTPRTIPPPTGETWADVTAGDGFTCARTTDNTGHCWGTSLHGALGHGTGANLPVTVRYEARARDPR